MTSRVRPFISHVRSPRSFGASVLIFALLYSPQLAVAQSVFTQQGPKLVGTGAVGGASEGWSVALSGDGNTATVGGPNDNAAAGATWAFTRSNGVWTQQGNKLVGTGASGQSAQGASVAADVDSSKAACLASPTINAAAAARTVGVFITIPYSQSFSRRPKTTALPYGLRASRTGCSTAPGQRAPIREAAFASLKAPLRPVRAPADPTDAS
jgi:hypothetical protein